MLDHLDEMFSVVYTPTEGEAIQNYSRIFRRPQGVFLNVHDVDRVRHDLSLWGTAEAIDYIVVTGEDICLALTQPYLANSVQMVRRYWASATRAAAAS